jgi:hypothetical protein
MGEGEARCHGTGCPPLATNEKENTIKHRHLVSRLIPYESESFQNPGARLETPYLSADHLFQLPWLTLIRIGVLTFLASKMVLAAEGDETRMAHEDFCT